MAGSGTGVPLWFKCPNERRETGYAILLRQSVDAVRRRHVVTPTGSAKPNRPKRGHHPRMSWTSFGYTCSCGHYGWSAHLDLERLAVNGGHVPFEEVEGNLPSGARNDALVREFRRRYNRAE